MKISEIKDILKAKVLCGEDRMDAVVVAGGAASPGEVEVVVGDIPSRVETNSNIRVPAASGSVTA